MVGAEATINGVWVNIKRRRCRRKTGAPRHDVRNAGRISVDGHRGCSTGPKWSHDVVGTES